MATATHAEPKAEPKHEETPKERADRELQEFLKKNPSTLKVETPETEVDRLRNEGVAIPEVYTAPLPGGGPSTQPGMSAGGHVPDKEEVQKVVDENSKELKKQQEKEKSEKKADEKK